MLALAHVGHWAVTALYVAPLLVAAAAILLASIRSRRAAQARRGGQR